MSHTDTILTHVITQDKFIFSNYYQCGHECHAGVCVSASQI